VYVPGPSLICRLESGNRGSQGPVPRENEGVASGPAGHIAVTARLPLKLIVSFAAAEIDQTPRIRPGFQENPIASPACADGGACGFHRDSGNDLEVRILPVLGNGIVSFARQNPVGSGRSRSQRHRRPGGHVKSAFIADDVVAIPGCDCGCRGIGIAEGRRRVSLDRDASAVSIRSDPFPVRTPKAVASADPMLPVTAADRMSMTPPMRIPLSPLPASIPVAAVWRIRLRPLPPPGPSDFKGFDLICADPGPQSCRIRTGHDARRHLP